MDLHLIFHLNAQTVVGEFHIFGQTGRYIPVEAHLVADVDEIGFIRIQFVGEFDGLIQRKVGGMLFNLQGIKYQDLTGYLRTQIGRIYRNFDLAVTLGELIAEVAFTEWTRDGRLRHPVFRGLREDKDPKEIPPDPDVY